MNNEEIEQRNEEIAHNMTEAVLRCNVGLPASLLMARFLVTREISIAITVMLNQNVGESERVLLQKAEEIYNRLGGPLIPEDEEE